MYSSMVGALILARTVNDKAFAREILTEARAHPIDANEELLISLG